VEPQSLRLSVADLKKVKGFLGCAVGDELLEWALGVAQGEDASRKNASAVAMSRMQSDELIHLGYGELVAWAKQHRDDADALDAVCQAFRHNLNRWVASRGKTWFGLKALAKIEKRAKQLRERLAAPGEPFTECDTSAQGVTGNDAQHILDAEDLGKQSPSAVPPLGQQLAGFDYPALSDYIQKHWDSIERLKPATIAFRRNLPKWSVTQPADWRGSDEIEKIERRMYELLQRTKPASPNVSPLPSALPHQQRSVSQPQGVPVWPDEALEGAHEALQGNCFDYERGVLSFMGYGVGHASQLTQTRRRRILDYVYRGALPQVNDRLYMQEWGKPGTSKRLRKLANALAAFARNARRKHKQNWGLAIGRWENDLTYLKERYYDRRARDWAWPQTIKK
jgi:hypothetical protein